jgi:serine/threonine protein kinase
LYFDFGPFVENKDLRASSLEDFLTSLDDMDAVDSFPVQDKIVSDVASGLMFLHSCDCYHRDLKTANILVSNQHYCSLKKDEIAEAFHKEPIVCKLTDLVRVGHAKFKLQWLKVPVLQKMLNAEHPHTWPMKSWLMPKCQKQEVLI